MLEKQFLPADSKQCENCEATLTGPFCSVCGQENTSSIRYFGTVILHLLDDIFSFDSRASRTLLPLFAKPGFLTQKYFDGKRVHYVPPLRLYLFISIVFFLSLKFFTDVNTPIVPMVAPQVMQNKIDTQLKQLQALPTSANNKAAIDKLKILKQDIAQSAHVLLQNQSIKLAHLELKKLTPPAVLTDDEKIQYEQFEEYIKDYKAEQAGGEDNVRFIRVGNQKDGSVQLDFLSKEMNETLNQQVKVLENKAEHVFSSDPTKLIQQTIAKLPQLMFVLLPIFALLLKVMFLFSNRLYMEHLTVALHSHSFIFLVILMLELLDESHDFAVDKLPLVADITSTLSVGLLIWVPVYLFIMQKRVYRQGYLLTTIKYMVISTIYFFMIAITGLSALIWGLTSL